jgi:hypothetical protein
MKFKKHIIFAVFGLLIISLGILHPAQAQLFRVDEGFAFNDEGQLFGYVSAIQLDSPVNTTYTTNHVSLDFVVKTFVMGGIIDTIMSYSIDGKDNVTVPTSATFIPLEADVTYTDGTKTKAVSQFYSHYLISGSVDLKDLQSGEHSLTIFGHYTRRSTPDEIGFATQTVWFTINDEKPSSHNIDINADVSKSGQQVSVFYVSLVTSLIAVVVFALFVKLRTRNNLVGSQT